MGLKWLKQVEKMKNSEFIQSMPEKKFTSEVRVVRQEITRLEKYQGPVPGAEFLIFLASLHYVLTALSMWFNKNKKR
jgi:hypothetical protein